MCAKNQWTGGGTICWAMKAEGKKLKIRRKTFIDFRITRNSVQTMNPPKKSTWPYLNEFLPYSWYEDKGIKSSAFIYFFPPWPCSDNHHHRPPPPTPSLKSWITSKPSKLSKHTEFSKKNFPGNLLKSS